MDINSNSKGTTNVIRKMWCIGWALLLLAGCKGEDAKKAPVEESKAEATAEAPASPGELVVYVGRNLSLVKPLIEKFEKQTGIEVKTRDGKSPELAALLVEEGDKTAADVFWAQDVDSLALVASKGLFAKVPEGAKFKTSKLFTGRSPYWVPLSGRARLLAYNPKKIAAEDLPKSILDLTDPKYAGQVGWAPSNASFQTFVTALRAAKGEEAAEAWLRGLKDNGAKTYAKNTPIIKALGAEEISMGLPNHYYLLRQKAVDAKFPVEQTFFADGDIGNLINVSGAGITKGAANRKNAEAFLTFLGGIEAQTYFADETFEYPVRPDVDGNKRLEAPIALPRIAPEIDLDKLGDREGTLALLQKVGLL